MRGEGGRGILKCHYYTIIMRGVRHGNRASTLSLTECDPPPPPSPSQKNPGHAPEEEKEIAELSKKESTRSISSTLISAKQKQNGYDIPLYLL